MSHLNINSIRNKFTSLKEVISCKIGFCLLSETKIDKTFSNTQFEIGRYKIVSIAITCEGGGMFYINENIPCRKLISNNLPKQVESIPLESSLRNREWLYIGIYKPPNQNESVFLDNLGKELTNLAFHYDNFILLENLSLTVENKNLNSFIMSSA